MILQYMSCAGWIGFKSTFPGNLVKIWKFISHENHQNLIEISKREFKDLSNFDLHQLKSHFPTRTCIITLKFQKKKKTYFSSDKYISRRVLSQTLSRLIPSHHPHHPPILRFELTLMIATF